MKMWSLTPCISLLTVCRLRGETRSDVGLEVSSCPSQTHLCICKSEHIHSHERVSANVHARAHTHTHTARTHKHAHTHTHTRGTLTYSRGAVVSFATPSFTGTKKIHLEKQKAILNLGRKSFQQNRCICMHILFNLFFLISANMQICLFFVFVLSVSLKLLCKKLCFKRVLFDSVSPLYPPLLGSSMLRSVLSTDHTPMLTDLPFPAKPISVISLRTVHATCWEDLSRCVCGGYSASLCDLQLPKNVCKCEWMLLCRDQVLSLRTQEGPRGHVLNTWQIGCVG